MSDLKVVLFTGGRGSLALSRSLARNPHVQLTLAVNGYDDGKSTGAVRRFLEPCLGPSDFRKNAATQAKARRSCPPELIELLSYRLPEPCSQETALAMLGRIDPDATVDRGDDPIWHLSQALPAGSRKAVAVSLAAFERELETTDNGFCFADCAVGNLVFAGCFLQADRHFGDAVDRYAALVGLPEGLILNVTDGTNAHLVAIDRNGLLLATEAEIVDATHRNHIGEIYLLDSGPDSRVRLEGPEALAVVEAHEIQVRPNQVLLERVDQADLIIYAPGTQHSSLFPSYLTQELGPRIAQNVGARKILVTNIQEDAEIPGISAVDIVDRALYYLRQRGTRPLPAPSLITHYLINDPESSKSTTPYVPLGSLQSLEDPRLVRIANYEYQQSGRHDAERVLEPFIDSLLESERQERRVAVLLLETDSIDKITQTVLEATRAGIADGRLQASFYYASDDTLVPELRNALPVTVTNVRREGATDEASFREHLSDGEFEYVALFESSGMYRGEDLVNLLSLLRTGRLDAAWGSRRLFRSDVRESYRMRYRRAFFIGALSYLGSHLLSLGTLVLFGRYISDTLSGVRAVRYSLLSRVHCTLDDKSLNHHLLARVLRDRGEILETPVHFISMSPEKAKRTGPSEGLRALGTLLAGRLWRP